MPALKEIPATKTRPFPVEGGMECPRCQQENPRPVKFYLECAARR